MREGSNVLQRLEIVMGQISQEVFIKRNPFHIIVCTRADFNYEKL